MDYIQHLMFSMKIKSIGIFVVFSDNKFCRNVVPF